METPRAPGVTGTAAAREENGHFTREGRMRRTLIPVALSAAVVLGAGRWLATAAPGDAAAPAGEARPPVTEARQRTLEAVKRAYEAAVAARHRGDAAGVSADAVFEWSRRWMEAERQVARDAPARNAAVEAHLARVKTAADVAELQFKAGFIGAADVEAARFYLAQASQWVAEGDGG
jgi:hypothetical protein